MRGLDELWDHHARHEYQQPPSARPGLDPLRALLPFLKPYRGNDGRALGAFWWRRWPCWRCPSPCASSFDHIVAAKDRQPQWYLFGFLRAVHICVFAALRFYLVTWLGERVVAGPACGRLPARVPGPDVYEPPG